jgi:hypothetical protein
VHPGAARTRLDRAVPASRHRSRHHIRESAAAVGLADAHPVIPHLEGDPAICDLERDPGVRGGGVLDHVDYGLSRDGNDIVGQLVHHHEIHASGVEWMTPWQAGDKFNYFEIEPTTITGRFIKPKD